MFTRFYDSIGEEWPAGAQYVALYYDSSLNDGFQPQKSDAPNQRWITRRGGVDAAAHTGIADFENHNLVYTGTRLREWAQGRVANGYRFRVYCNRSDVRPAFSQVHDLNPLWWIATLDNDSEWNPDKIVQSVEAITGIELDTASIWGIQWGTNPQYDTSYLTGEW